MREASVGDMIVRERKYTLGHCTEKEAAEVERRFVPRSLVNEHWPLTKPECEALAAARKER